MKEYTTERSPVHVNIVTNHLHRANILSDTREFIPMRNHMCVSFMTNDSLPKLASQEMREFTPVRYHIHVNIVTKNSNRIVVLADIRSMYGMKETYNRNRNKEKLSRKNISSDDNKLLPSLNKEILNMDPGRCSTILILLSTY